MKTFRFFILAGFAAAIVALIWQARTIVALRAEVTGLRGDLRVCLGTALENSTNQTQRDELELIKLRHRVRELNEQVVESHAREQTASLRAAVRQFLPSSVVSGPWKFRPEWNGMEAQATNQYAQAMQALTGATNEFLRFLTLGRAAKMSLAVGRTEDARQCATDLLVLDGKYSRGNPTQANGDAVHDGHLVLGRIAVDDGRIGEAKGHLLAAGKSNGSPLLNSFGPNMGLAKDLLEKGEQRAVLDYLESCRKFWTSDNGKLDEWTKDIQAGRIPNFGANLLY